MGGLGCDERARELVGLVHAAPLSLRRLSLCAFALCVAACSADRQANDRYGAPCMEDSHYRGFCIDGGRSERDAGPGDNDGGQADAGPGIASGDCELEGMQRGCYPRDRGNAGEGICLLGEQMCSSGVWGQCIGWVPALEAERCNGEDDDCDGTTDEVPPDSSCDTGRLGACMGGQPVCQGGLTVCQPDAGPTAEVCNGQDDDCDGMQDEGAARPCYPADTTGCTANPDGSFTCVGRCAPGSRECSGGTQGTCSGMVVPANEDPCTDDVIAYDDDCDGMVDEDCTSCTPGTTQQCYGGAEGTQAIAPCTLGVQACSTGGFGPCEDDRVPTQETCENDGVNDDCDMQLDDIPGRGMACIDDAKKGVCRNGTLDCQDGEFGCVTPAAREPELCDGLDDDCNGVVDDGFRLLTDPLNCGQCGVQCSEGLSCCGGQCVDLETSEDHCGECGDPCGDGSTCCGATCVDTDVNTDHCGACGEGCGDGRACCGGGCVDTRVSTDHCGSCDDECDNGESCCSGTCAQASAPACQTCSPDCTASEECCSGSCVDMQSDESNCGACGTTCDAGEICCGGDCVASNPSHCGQACSICDQGDLCCSGSCVPSDAANCYTCGNLCTAGMTCCGATGCKNLQSDPSNCGACGTPVDEGDQCTSGHSCPPNNLWCNGACTSIVNNNDHCGGCNRPCGLLQSCQGTMCRLL